MPPPGEPGERQTGSGYGRSSAEAVTALGPTRLQHGASGAGAHACAEPVLAGLASVVGLKGALHGASCGDKLPRGARGLCDFPVPAARDESEPQANAATTHYGNVGRRTLTASCSHSCHLVSNLEYPQALTTVTFPVEMTRGVIHTLWISLWTTLEEAHHE